MREQLAEVTPTSDVKVAVLKAATAGQLLARHPAVFRGGRASPRTFLGNPRPESVSFAPLLYAPLEQGWKSNTTGRAGAG